MANYGQIFETLLTSQRAAGVTLSGGFAYFYSPGTTTLKTIYADRAKTTPAANPYTLSSDGTAMIYGDGLYDVKITNSALVQKFLWENIALQDASGEFYTLSNYADLPAAVTAIGSTKATLLIPSNTSLSADLTIPATMTIQPINGAIITIASGKTLIINGTLIDPGDQCIAGVGAVTGLKESRPEWFEVNTTPGTTDMTNAFNKAAASVKTNGGIVRISATQYLISSMVYFDNVSLQGADGFYSWIHVSGNITALKFTGARKKISNFQVWFDDYSSSAAPTTAVGVQFGGSTYGTGSDQFSNNIVENVYVRYAGRSFASNSAGTSGTVWNNTFINCRSDFAAEYGWYFNSITGSTTQTWIDCMVDGVTVDGSMGWSATSAGWYINNIEDLVWLNCQADDMQDGNAINVNLAGAVTIDNFRSEASQLTTNASRLIYVNASARINNVKVQAMTCDVGAGNRGSIVVMGSNGRGIIGDINYQAVKITSGTLYKVDSNALQFGAGHVNLISGDIQRAEVRSDDAGERTVFSGKSLRFGATLGAPTVGTFELGDQIRQLLSSTNSTVDRYCTTAGTLGTLNSGATTATTTAASNVISVNSVTGLYQGNFVAIAGVTGTKRIVSVVSASEIYIDSAADATVTGAATAYVAPVFSVGTGAPIVGSATYDPPSVAAGAIATTTVTATGAAVGDISLTSFSLNLAGLVISSYVSAANTVTVQLHNPTAGAIDLASGTLRVKVIDQ